MSQESFNTFYGPVAADTAEKLKHIRLVVFDVDGTITDGRIILDNGQSELKHFSCKDGMGFSLLHKAGIRTAIITGRDSPLTARRAAELKVDYVIQGQADKEEAVTGLIKDLDLTEKNVAVLGDDINDIPLFEHAAVSAAPADGYMYMRKKATIVLSASGGAGAARELADLILMAQEKISPDDGCPLFLLKNKKQEYTVQ